MEIGGVVWGVGELRDSIRRGWGEMPPPPPPAPGVGV